MADYVDFDGANFTWKGFGEDVGDVRVHMREAQLNGKTATESISCWKLTPDELAEVRRTGLVYLSAFGRHPIVALSGFDPTAS